MGMLREMASSEYFSYNPNLPCPHPVHKKFKRKTLKWKKDRKKRPNENEK